MGVVDNSKIRISARNNILEQEKRLSFIIDKIPAILWTADRDFTITSYTGKGLKTLGLKPEDRIGKKIANKAIDLLDEDKKKILKACETALKGKKSYYEASLPGSYWKSFVEPLKDQDNKIVGIVGVSFDFSQGKENEEELINAKEQLSLAIESSGIGLWDWNVQTGEVEFNEQWAQIIGYKLSELEPISIKTWERLCHPDDLKKSEVLLNQHFSGKSEFYDCEARMKHKDGHWVHVYDRGKVVSWVKKGKPLRMIGTHIDITDRKNTEDFLKESEEKYKALFSKMINGFAYHKIIVDKKGRPVDYEFIEVNFAFEHMIGLKAKDIIGKRVTVVIPGIEKDSADWIGKYGDVALNGKEMRFENYSDSLNKWFHISVFSPQKGYFVTIFEDISKKKVVENELLSKTLLLEAQTNSTVDGILIVDQNQRQVLTNKRMFEIFDVPKKIQDDKDDAKMLNHVVSLIKYPKIFLDKVKYLYKHPYKTSQDEIELKSGVMLDRYSAPVLGKDGKNYGRIWTFRDITLMKTFEAQLKKLNIAIEQSIQGIGIADLKGDIIYVNPAWCKMHGYTKQEIVGKNLSIFHTPEQLKNEVLPFNESIKTKGNNSGEIGHKRKDGSTFQTLMSISTIKDENGISIGLVGTAIDITKQKEAEKSIKDEKEFSETILSSIPNGVDIVDEDLNIFYMNSVFLSIFGNKSVGKKCFNVYKDDKTQCEYCPLKKPIKVGETRKIISDKIAGGKIFEITHTGILLKNKKKAVLEVFRDITEERKFQETQRMLSAGVNQSSDTIVITDTEGNIIYANPSFERTTGYKVSEAFGKNPRMLNSGKQDKSYYKAMWNTIKSGRTWYGEFINKRKDNSLYTERVMISPIFDDEEKIVNFIAIKTDITKEKEAGEKVIEQVKMLNDFKALEVEKILESLSDVPKEHSSEESRDVNPLAKDATLPKTKKHSKEDNNATEYDILRILEDINDIKKMIGGLK